MSSPTPPQPADSAPANPHEQHPTDTHAKALAINLEATIYGTFAEIGAGQEVARWFLSVGAASGTVAQAISAYDKTVSDDTYGSGTRYVSKERLRTMLDHEYKLLTERLGKERGERTRFFVFADTVATRNYQGTNQQHGWVGMRFQAEVGAPCSEVLLHINLRDPHAELQQQAIGVLGVNLIYAAYHQRGVPDVFMKGLFDGLSKERLDIDVVELNGPSVEGLDARLVALEMLRRGLAEVLVFDSQGKLVEPSTPLRKRPLILERMMVERPGLFTKEMFEGAKKQLLAEGKTFEREPAFVLELSLASDTEAAPSSNEETLERIEKLTPLGTVIVTAYLEAYHTTAYLQRFTKEPIRMLMAIAALFHVVESYAYRSTPGALLEAFGRLLAADVAIYVAPMKMEPFVAALGGMPGGFVIGSAESDSMTLEDFHPKPPLNHLFDYLQGAGRMVALKLE